MKKPVNRINKALRHFRAYAYGEPSPDCVATEWRCDTALDEDDKYIILKGLQTLLLMAVINPEPQTEDGKKQWEANVKALQAGARELMIYDPTRPD